MLSLFKKREARALDLAKTLTFEGHQIVRQGLSLHMRLSRVAALVHKAFPVTGVLVVAHDGHGETLEFATLESPSTEGNFSDFTELSSIKRLCGQIAAGDAEGADVVRSTPLGPLGSFSFAKRLHLAERHYATLVLSATRPFENDFSIGALDFCQETLAWVVQSYLADRDHRVNLNLHRLVRDAQQEPVADLQRLVESLAELLKADAVTLLIREQGKLYLSATTDASIQEQKGRSEADKTLTAKILESAKPICLFDATDPKELEETTGLVERVPGIFSETLLRDGHSHHFLGVRLPGALSQFNLDPDRIEALGALRIVRRKVPFAAFENRALLNFAEILGSFLGGTWEHFISKKLWRSRTDAIAVSRYEPHFGPEEEKGTPKIVAANEGFEQLVDVETGKLEGTDARVFYADGEYEKRRVDIASAIAAGQDQCGPYDTILRAANGTLKNITITYRIFSSPFVSPPAHYTASIIRDRTQEALRETRLRRLVELLDEMGLAYFRADLNGVTTQTSETESRILRYPKDKLKGKPREDLYANARDRGELIRQVKKKDGRLVETMQRLKRSDEEVVFAKGVIRLLKAEDGSAAGLEGLYEDVSDRMHLQDFLGAGTEHLLEDAELSTKVRQDAEFNLDYMTTLSHQIQTPLTALAANLKNLRNGIDSIHKDSPQIAYIIGQIKTCTRLAANLSFIDLILREKAFEFEKCNLAQLAIAERLNFRHLLKQERKRLVVDGSSLDKYLETAWGNTMLLKQVFFNLIDNAIKYSRENTTIRIAGKAGRYGGLLEISNFGIPISTADRRKVFDRGFRTKKARAHAPGTGLGLWLVEKIIKAHSGWIQCDSFSDPKIAGEGVVFRIFFPEKKPSKR